MEVTCLKCGKVRNIRVEPVYCTCGNVIGKVQGIPKPTKTPVKIHRPAIRHSDLCRTNECGACYGGTCKIHVEKQAKKGIEVAGSVDYLDTHPRVRCPAPNPLWYVGEVGFLVVTYMEIGGTETWHQTLIPKMRDVSGFVCAEEKFAAGDFSKLGCQTGIGWEAAKRLLRDSKVVVVWGLGNGLNMLLESMKSRPKIISVAHCDDKSSWTKLMMKEQAPNTDLFVHINKAGRKTVPEDRIDDARLIYNGVDLKRLRITEPRSKVRERLGVSADQVLCVSLSRLSPEKNIRLPVLALKELGDKYQYRFFGDRTGWNEQYANGVQSLADSTSNCRLRESTTEVGNILNAADIYISCSSYEGFGLSIAEAMAMGVQVIATPVGFVEDEPQTARLIPLTPSLQDIQRAVESSEDTRAIARKTIYEKYSADIFAKNWQKTVDQLLFDTPEPG